VERQHRLPLPEHVAAEGDHLTAVDVVLNRRLADLARGPGRDTGRGGRDLDGRRALPHVPIAPPDQQDKLAALVVHQVDRADHTGAHLSVRSGRKIQPGDVPRHRAVEIMDSGRPHQLGEPEVVMPEVHGPDQLVVPSPLLEPCVEPGLDVDVVVGRPRLLDDLQRGRIGAEVITDQPLESRPVLRAGNPHEATPGAPGQLLGVGQPEPVVVVLRIRLRLEPG
jgi:hypothetical protein